MSKYVITKQKETLFSVLFDDKGKELEICTESVEESRLHNIYLAQVTNIVKNIDAAFLTIENGINCYCSMKEKVPYLFGAHGSMEKLCVGDYVVVQLVKENIKQKQPSVSGKFELTGKYLVLLHGEKGIKTSQKITSEPERKRLQEIMEPYQNESFAFIIRTNASDVTKERLLAEAEQLEALYREIKEKGVHQTRGSLLYQSQPWYVENLRDVRDSELSEVITDSPEVYTRLVDFAQKYQPESLKKLRFYQDEALSLSSLYSFQKVIKEALSSQIWLKSGAFLVIEPTETLTVIDVNTGKSVNGKKTGDAMFLSINLEAAAECMHQLRLRNLSGMIMIDFINMESKENNEKLMSYVRELAKKDRVPVTVVDMTGLKLVELTRKKVKKPLHEQITSAKIS